MWKGFAMKAKMVREIFVAFFLPAMAWAQTQTSSAAKPAPNSAGLGAYEWNYRAGLTCGAGASESSASVKPTVQCGGIFSILPVVNLETGVMGPQAKHSSVSGYLTTDLVLPVWAPGKTKRNLVLFAAGYTRMFETGNALDYGLALSRSIDSKHSIQFEVRDTWVNANPIEHNVVFRVVWLIGVPD
jgi:hypothetical protein